MVEWYMYRTKTLKKNEKNNNFATINEYSRNDAASHWHESPKNRMQNHEHISWIRKTEPQHAMLAYKGMQEV